MRKHIVVANAPQNPLASVEPFGFQQIATAKA